MTSSPDISELYNLARGDIDSTLAYHVGTTISPAGDEALVVLGVGDPADCRLDVTHFVLEDGHWAMRFSTSESCGIGFSATDGENGVMYVVERAPSGVTSAIVRGKSLDQNTEVDSLGFIFASSWGRTVSHQLSAEDVSVRWT